MRIDKRTIDSLCKMNDEKLWGAVRLFASSTGVALPSARPCSEDMQRLRHTISNLSDSDISRAVEMLKNFKG